MIAPAWSSESWLPARGHRRLDVARKCDTAALEFAGERGKTKSCLTSVDQRAVGCGSRRVPGVNLPTSFERRSSQRAAAKSPSTRHSRRAESHDVGTLLDFLLGPGGRCESHDRPHSYSLLSTFLGSLGSPSVDRCHMCAPTCWLRPGGFRATTPDLEQGVSLEIGDDSLAHINLGEIPAGGRVERVITLRNTTTSSVRLSRFDISCDCLTVEDAERDIAPGGLWPFASCVTWKASRHLSAL
jgi:hypothetical protein